MAATLAKAGGTLVSPSVLLPQATTALGCEAASARDAPNTQNEIAICWTHGRSFFMAVQLESSRPKGKHKLGASRAAGADTVQSRPVLGHFNLLAPNLILSLAVVLAMLLLTLLLPLFLLLAYGAARV